MKNLFPTQSALAALRNRQVWERVLKNKIPRQGTETISALYCQYYKCILKNKIPRQGTETYFQYIMYCIHSLIEK